MMYFIKLIVLYSWRQEGKGSLDFFALFLNQNCELIMMNSFISITIKESHGVMR